MKKTNSRHIPRIVARCSYVRSPNIWSTDFQRHDNHFAPQQATVHDNVTRCLCTTNGADACVMRLRLRFVVIHWLKRSHCFDRSSAHHARSEPRDRLPVGLLWSLRNATASSPSSFAPYAGEVRPLNRSVALSSVHPLSVPFISARTTLRAGGRA